MTKVRLYEDIDGCLNASWNARAWRSDEDEENVGYQRDWVFPEYDDYGFRKGPSGIKYRMEWNERLIEALNGLDVEFVWATTWRGDALKVGTAMKLIHQPQRVLHPRSGETTFPSIEWKFDAIVAEQEQSPSPFIAVDDEWNDGTGSNRTQTLVKLGGLVISPSFNFGIEPRHILQMREYVEKHS